MLLSNISILNRKLCGVTLVLVLLPSRLEFISSMLTVRFDFSNETVSQVTKLSVKLTPKSGLALSWFKQRGPYLQKMTGWIYFVISRKLNSFVSVTVSLSISVYFWHYRFSYERFYNSNSNPLAFYQIVFSRQDAVSYKQYEKIRPDSKW